ncbi:MAG: hypothetical protein CVV09_19695 [Gammaproteobacteria bacterium HGW-Gammaproteobacteria-13]|nr:MAG: hypothetical protein CVV09_19695 [Gammaproteobacteria bacterium HGW-Gammaproteobacteria-13]
MNIDIKHKHAGHVIMIEGHPFKANSAGQWNLTEVWRALKLDQKKSPGQWRTKEAKRLEAMQNLHSSNGAASWATKRATIEYAAWVSPEFKDMVFDAFEAVLENPEVAQVVAEKMRQLGYGHSASLLEREKDNFRQAMKEIKRSPQSQTDAAKAHRLSKRRDATLEAMVRRNKARLGC